MGETAYSVIASHDLAFISEEDLIDRGRFLLMSLPIEPPQILLPILNTAVWLQL